jgi:hypothetical protein
MQKDALSLCFLPKIARLSLPLPPVEFLKRQKA